MTNALHFRCAVFLLFIAIALRAANAEQSFRVYVTNESSGELSIIDPTTLQAKTIPLGKRPRGIHASPDGKTIYVALSGSPIAGPGVDESKLPPPDRSADGIGVFDVKQQKIVRVIQSGIDPENFDISQDGTRIVVSNEDDARASLIDIASGKIVSTFPVGEEPEGVKFTPDGKFVYVTSEDKGTIAVLDIGDGKVSKTIKVGRRPRSVAFLPDGSRAYVNAENDGSVAVIDARKHETIQTISLGQPGVIKPMAVLLSADAKTLYVSTGRGHRVFVIDTTTNRVTSSFEVGERPWGIALSPDGKTLYTANGPSNDVSVVDLASQKVTAKVKVGRGPWGVIVLQQ
ncbi:MAG TPA: beta-propeller fold lactonase family protein [Terriglobales bacterium]|nr:beta-propeller fold lactonase family protein [Terriglobales bacterium]